MEEAWNVCKLQEIINNLPVLTKHRLCTIYCYKNVIYCISINGMRESKLYIVFSSSVLSGPRFLHCYQRVVCVPYVGTHPLHTEWKEFQSWSYRSLREDWRAFCSRTKEVCATQLFWEVTILIQVTNKVSLGLQSFGMWCYIIMAWTICGLIPSRNKRLFLMKSIQIESRAHSTSYSVGQWVLPIFPGVGGGGGYWWLVAGHSPPSSAKILRLCGAVPLLPPYAFMACTRRTFNLLISYPVIWIYNNLHKYVEVNKMCIAFGSGFRPTNASNVACNLWKNNLYLFWNGVSVKHSTWTLSLCAKFFICDILYNIFIISPHSGM